MYRSSFPATKVNIKDWLHRARLMNELLQSGVENGVIIDGLLHFAPCPSLLPLNWSQSPSWSQSPGNFQWTNQCWLAPTNIGWPRDEVRLCLAPAGPYHTSRFQCGLCPGQYLLVGWLWTALTMLTAKPTAPSSRSCLRAQHLGDFGHRSVSGTFAQKSLVPNSASIPVTFATSGPSPPSSGRITTLVNVGSTCWAPRNQIAGGAHGAAPS